jgi:hypothetical protein
MTRHGILRLLRIAASAACLVVCGLLIALWSRSYWWVDRIDGPVGRFFPGRTVTAVSVRGLLMVGIQPEQYNVYAAVADPWRINSARIETVAIRQIDDAYHGFKIIRDKNEWGLQLPCWAAVAATAFCAALPWLKWTRRFSLRTLLVVTTIAAVTLGLVAAWSR